MPEPDPPLGPVGSLLDEADWAILSTGVIDTNPPLIVEALAFTIPNDLQPIFDYLTTAGIDDTETLAEFVAEASGVEFEAFSSVTGLAPGPSGDPSAQVDSLLRELIAATGVEMADGRDLAAELADLHLPVFGSQSRGSKPLKEWARSAGDGLMAVGVLAGSHAPALLVFAGPAGAIITLATLGGAGGVWAVSRLRKRRQDRRKAAEAEAEARAKAQAEADAEAAAKAAAKADAETAAHNRTLEIQRRLKEEARKRKFKGPS